MITTALAAGLAGLAATLGLQRPRTLSPRRVQPAVSARGATDTGWMQRWRPMLCGLAGVAAASFVGGYAGIVAGVITAGVVWNVIARAEPAGRRRERERASAELPHVVRLLGAALSSGAAPAEALEVVAAALPGPAADRLAPVALRLRLGADPGRTWSALAADPALGSLGRALARAHDSGASVAVSVARLADDLSRSARADVEDRARAVGVRAAAPLGLCLLPAFLLIGVVPLVGGLISSLRL